MIKTMYRLSFKQLFSRFLPLAKNESLYIVLIIQLQAGLDGHFLLLRVEVEADADFNRADDNFRSDGISTSERYGRT